MIIRLVKLTFHASGVDEFLNLFISSEESIKKFPGCLELYLYRDNENHPVFFTYSIWKSEADLNFYRNSEIFIAIWNKCKPLFSSRAEAWSLTKVGHPIL